MSHAPAESHGSGAKSVATLPPELEPYREACEAFIRRYVRNFATAAGDASLTFTPGTGFTIDLVKGNVTLDVRDWQWAEKHGLSHEQIYWSVLHELSHFHDLRENAKGMLENFADMRTEAETLGLKILDIWRTREGGTLPAHITPAFAENFAYTELHGFVNALDDMYVNSGLGARHPEFAYEGVFEDSVQRLYRDFLFPREIAHRGEPDEGALPVDYTAVPRSRQLGYKLLRDRMVRSQETLVAPEVAAHLSSGRDRVRSSLGKTRGVETEKLTRWMQRGDQRDPRKRFLELMTIHLDGFREMLLHDAANLPLPPEPPPPPPGPPGPPGGEPPPPGKPGDDPPKPGDGPPKPGDGPPKPGDGPPKPGDGPPKPCENPWQKPNDRPDPLMEEGAIREFIKQTAAKKKKDDDIEKLQREMSSLSPDERAERQDAAHIRRALKDKCKTPEEQRRLDEAIAQYQRIAREVAPNLDELADVFEQFMSTINEKLSRVIERWYISGKFSTDEFIRKYGIETATGHYELVPWGELGVYERAEIIKGFSVFPNRIRIRLSVDCSSSMSETAGTAPNGKKPSKMDYARWVYVMMLEGLAAFEGRVNRRFSLQEPFFVDTQVIGFGDPSQTAIVKDLREHRTDGVDEFSERVWAFSKLDDSHGSTSEAAGLHLVLDTLSEDDVEAIGKGQLVDVVLELTDGDPNTMSGRMAVQDGNAEEQAYGSPARETKTTLNMLKKRGVVYGAFMMGVGDGAGSSIFRATWGDRGRTIERGKDVVDGAAHFLKDVMESIRVRVMQSGVPMDDE